MIGTRYLWCAGLLAASACTSWGAGTPLSIVKAVLSDRDSGAALPADYPHQPGETMFFSFQVDGFTPSSGDRVHLSYKVQALDPKGVLLEEPVSAEIEETLAAEDKNWKPIVRQEIVIPPLAGSGTYKIEIALNDIVAKATASKEVPFQVHGHDVAPSDTLVIRNLHFYRSDSDRQPMERAAYRPGETVWARFDIIGYKYGAGNALEVSYDVAVLSPSGKTVYTRPDADTDRSQAYYPKRFVPAVMSLSTKPDTRPGEYTVVLTAHDGVGKQTFEARRNFSIQ
ncbi:MAG TPA: hypothetical protein VMI94_05900 [Bryobacteraceae bacterium]|nr:hypothetical protein [Bryobacteraceae bacterium]